MAKINVTIAGDKNKSAERVQVELPISNLSRSRESGKCVWSASVTVGTQILRVVRYSETEPDEYNAFYMVKPENAYAIWSREWTKSG